MQAERKLPKSIQHIISQSKVLRRSIGLLVPYEDRAKAKAIGAKWNPIEKAWVWPLEAERAPVRKWLPRMYRDDVNAPYITPMALPDNLWGVNLRYILKDHIWDELRKECYRSASYLCAVCGIKAKPPHCNEQWTLVTPQKNEQHGIVELARLACLCHLCHMIKHLGLANLKGWTDVVASHYSYVNDCTLPEAYESFDNALEAADQNRQHRWAMNLKWLGKKLERDLFIPVRYVEKLNDDYHKSKKHNSYKEREFSGLNIVPIDAGDIKRYMRHLFNEVSED